MFDEAYGERSAALKLEFLAKRAMDWRCLYEDEILVDAMSLRVNLSFAAKSRPAYGLLLKPPGDSPKLDTPWTVDEGREALRRSAIALYDFPEVRVSAGQEFGSFAWYPVLKEDPRIAICPIVPGPIGRVDLERGLVTRLLGTRVVREPYVAERFAPRFTEEELRNECRRVYRVARPYRTLTAERTEWAGSGFFLAVPDYSGMLNEMTDEHASLVRNQRAIVIYSLSFRTESPGGFREQAIYVDARTGRGIALEEREFLMLGPSTEPLPKLDPAKLTWTHGSVRGSLVPNSGAIGTPARTVALRSGSQFLAGDFDAKAGLVKLDGVVYRPSPELLAAMRKAPTGTFGKPR